MCFSLLFVFLANVPSIYVNLTAFVHMDERHIGQTGGAKLTRSFWVRTIDVLTEKQCRLSTLVNNSMPCVVSCMFSTSYNTWLSVVYDLCQTDMLWFFFCLSDLTLTSFAFFPPFFNNAGGKS